MSSGIAGRRGPVDLYLLRLPSEEPDSATLAALTELTDAGLLHVLDLLQVSRSASGITTILEATDFPDGFGIDTDSLGAIGLIGQEDVDALASVIPEGTSAVLLAVELVYQRELAERAGQSGAELLAYERIPAPVVNALLDSMTTRSEV